MFILLQIVGEKPCCYGQIDVTETHLFKRARKKKKTLSPCSDCIAQSRDLSGGMLESFVLFEMFK